MKNIHLLPTDKPSRLFKNTDDDLSLDDELQPNGVMCQNQNIYITSDEEIKEGDWFIALVDDSYDIYKAFEVLMNIVKENKYLQRKIILTTDQDLIKDGVQAIDDKFLQWFVKNPSCEEAELMNVYGYAEIIIPKEEPFKHECEVLSKEYIMENRSDAYEFIDFDKQETTLEEAAKKYDGENASSGVKSFIEGAKWQQDKNKYSKEDLDAFRKFMIQEQNFSKSCLDVFIEQFKKK